MKCYCNVCGEEGKEISRGLHALHSRSRALDEALSSTPQASTTLSALGATVPTDSSDEAPTATSTFQAGRDIVVKLMGALDDIAALQRTHRRLKNITFSGTDLIALTPTLSYPKRKEKRPILRLDPAAPANQSYFIQRDDLQRLLNAINEREASQTEVTLPTLMELKKDVLQTISMHESHALVASALAYERRDMYIEEGKGADIIHPGNLSPMPIRPICITHRIFSGSLISLATSSSSCLHVSRHPHQYYHRMRRGGHLTHNAPRSACCSTGNALGVIKGIRK